MSEIAVFQEIVRGNALDRAFFALDYFDASINRIAAYVIGARAARKALLAALLEPASLPQLEGAQKLAALEDLKTMSFGAVWEQLCESNGAPVDWFGTVQRYEKEVLAKRK